MRCIFTILLSILIGCASTAKYNIPTKAVLNALAPLPEVSLIDKAMLWNSVITFQFLDKNEHLLYRIFYPLKDNYAPSHDLEDMALWHGYWLSAQALHLSVIPNLETVRVLNKGLKAIRTHFKITGTPGLLANAYVSNPSEEPMEWMDDTWEKGGEGYWVRRGATAFDYDGPIFALALVTALHKNGDIVLDPETESLVSQTLIDISHAVLEGKVEGFDDWNFNGITALRLLALLKACAEYNELCEFEFDRMKFQQAFETVASDIQSLYNSYMTIGRENSEVPYGIDNAIYSHILTLHLLGEYNENVIKAMDNLWRVLQYSSNPFFAFVQSVISTVEPEAVDEAILTLQMYPENKIRIADLREADTASIQPLPNRPVVPHHWASSYFRQASKTVTSHETNEYLSGQDYLVAFWLGLRYGLITKDKAQEVPDWDKQ